MSGIGQEAGAVEKVRYGRATLMIARSQPERHFDDFDDLLAAYERGEARATSVAAAFLRDRVVDHTPSFEWRTAKLRPLIPIVCGLSEDPKLEASTPTELADALVRAKAQSEERSGNGKAAPDSTPKRRARLFRIPLRSRASARTGR